MDGDGAKSFDRWPLFFSFSITLDRRDMFGWDVNTPIHDVIGEAIGAASLCWERPDLSGVYDSEKASEIVNEVMEIIHRKCIKILD